MAQVNLPFLKAEGRSQAQGVNWKGPCVWAASALHSTSNGGWVLLLSFTVASAGGKLEQDSRTAEGPERTVREHSQQTAQSSGHGRSQLGGEALSTVAFLVSHPNIWERKCV